MSVRVGIVDTGILANGVVASASFIDEQAPVAAPTEEEHGSSLANIIRSNAPAADLLDARAFVAGHPSSAARIASAIDWLVEQDVQLINMSFGLQSNREVLELAVQRAQQAGAICIASTPAQGSKVYPSSYDSVVSVSGDARCSAGEFSVFEYGPHWHFGAANGGPDHRAHQRGHGASFACAHVTGYLARLLHSGVTQDRLFSRFCDHCYWTERENVSYR